jgi:cleavage and polyadenylation specificity factor subunit 3
MYRLKSALQSKHSEKEENVTIYTPKNCDTVKLHFRGEKMAKVNSKKKKKYTHESNLIDNRLLVNLQQNILQKINLLVVSW